MWPARRRGDDAGPAVRRGGDGAGVVRRDRYGRAGAGGGGRVPGADPAAGGDGAGGGGRCAVPGGRGVRLHGGGPGDRPATAPGREAGAAAGEQSRQRYAPRGRGGVLRARAGGPDPGERLPRYWPGGPARPAGRAAAAGGGGGRGGDTAAGDRGATDRGEVGAGKRDPGAG